jgi:enolase
MAKITRIIGREILDSRGFPTVEAEVHLDSGIVALADSPSGASTGKHEALELRDGDGARYLGKGVQKAVSHVNKDIAPLLQGMDPDDFAKIDQKMIDADGTENKSQFGANAILAVSLASAKAAAVHAKVSFAEWIHAKAAGLGYKTQMQMPIPLMNVINGGAHADNGLDVQEFMLVPHGFSKFSEALRAGAEVFHHLKKILSAKGLTVAVGDEGGFAPQLKSNENALEVLLIAIEKAGYRAGDQISLALDVAASEFYDASSYKFRDSTIGTVSGEQLAEHYARLCERFPIVSMEDAMAEDDWDSWKILTSKLGSKLQLVGDDLFVTQEKRLAMGVEKSAGNAILIKLNQVGSLLETLKTMKYASERSFKSVVSHRSGETEDVSLAHLAVGTGCGQVKTGSASRTDRLAKYNELLRLEERLGCPMAKWLKR